MKTPLRFRSKTLAARRRLAAFSCASLLTSTLVACGAYGAGADDYVAHEWGTFTSIQGGDGVLLDWNGIATSDLPPFVYDWTRAGLQRVSSPNLTKISITALQRMETPVIYFYAQKPMRVDVAVEFPLGRITEWYPQAAEIGPSFRPPGPVLAAIDNAATRAGVNTTPPLAAQLGEPPITNSVVRWKDIEVLPVAKNAILAPQLPLSARPSHYFAARATGAAFVRVPSLERTNPAPEIEKFLFYRGVGNFPSPLQVTVDEQGTMTVANAGRGPLKHLFAVEIQGERASVIPLGDLESGQTRQSRFGNSAEAKPATAAVGALRREMSDALVAEGLYRDEADAMVETWRDAWFEDQGVRILYILPRAWTDATLPMTLNPSPRELVRVMVGRAEIITPEMAQRVARCVEGFRQSDPATRQAAIDEFKAMRLGRFAHAALRVAGRPGGDAAFYEQGGRLIEAAAGADKEPARRFAASGG